MPTRKNLSPPGYRHFTPVSCGVGYRFRCHSGTGVHKCQWWLCGGLMWTIWYPFAMCTLKSEWSSQYHSVSLFLAHLYIGLLYWYFYWLQGYLLCCWRISNTDFLLECINLMIWYICYFHGVPYIDEIIEDCCRFLLCNKLLIRYVMSVSYQRKNGHTLYNNIHISMWFSQKSTVLHIVLFEFDTPVKLVRIIKTWFTEACVICGKHFSDVLPVQSGLKQGVNWAGHFIVLREAAQGWQRCTVGISSDNSW